MLSLFLLHFIYLRVISTISNKFLTSTGSGVINISDGSATIYGQTLGALNLNKSEPLKTNSSGILVSSNLEINDVNGLTSALAGAISNPLTGDLDASDNKILDTKAIEFKKQASTTTPPAGNVSLYINSVDGLLHEVDEAGTDNPLTAGVQFSGTVPADGDIVIFDGITGDDIKGSGIASADVFLSTGGNITGNLYVNNIDTTSGTSLNLGATVATKVNIGRNGINTEIVDDLLTSAQILANSGGTANAPSYSFDDGSANSGFYGNAGSVYASTAGIERIKIADADTTFSNAIIANSDATFNTQINLLETGNNDVGRIFQQDTTQSYTRIIDTYNTGGTTTADLRRYGIYNRSGGAQCITIESYTDANILSNTIVSFCHNGGIKVDGKIDTNSGVTGNATLTLGGTDATEVDISRTNILTDIKGSLEVQQVATMKDDLKLEADFVFDKGQLEAYYDSESTTTITTLNTWTPVNFGGMTQRAGAVGFTCDVSTTIGEVSINFSDRSRYCHCGATISVKLASGSNRQLSFSIWRTDGTPAMVAGSEVDLFIGNNASEAQSTAIHFFPAMVSPQKYRLYCKNVGGTENIIIKHVNMFYIATPNTV